jgi:ABC-2 type transport system ATP-binding protein
LSGGQKRRLAVALAFVGRPRLVLLDEPTTGLDVAARRALWEAIRQFPSDDSAVLLSSHYLEEIEALASRVVVIGSGRLLADDTVAAVRDLVALRRVSLVAPSLPDLVGVVGAQRNNNSIQLMTTDSDSLVRQLVSSGANFSDLEIHPASLEEAFLTLTSPGS